MAGYERVIEIEAPPAVVWAILEDVEKWPTWTPSILRVVRQESGTFGVGSTAKVKAKGFPEGLLRVTELSPGRSFTWQGSSGPGFRVLLGHAIEAVGAGSRVTLSITPVGPAAICMGWLAARMSKPNINIEAESLKVRAEQIARGA